MVHLIDTLHDLDIPLAFCFLYDEFWLVFMRLHVLLGHVLGPEYKRLPDFWSWRVDPQKSEAGWAVHRDKSRRSIFMSGMPKTITVWLPLTDATTSNGCMYMLPADRDPTYKTGESLRDYWVDVAPSIRALPVPSGGVLMWNQNVWHWGSRSNPHGLEPRFSLAMEFQSNPTTSSPYDPSALVEGFPSTDDVVEMYNLEIDDPLWAPAFAVRVKLVAAQILGYQHISELSEEFEDIARRIVRQANGNGDEL